MRRTKVALSLLGSAALAVGLSVGPAWADSGYSGGNSTGSSGNFSWGVGPNANSPSSATSVVGIANASSTGYWELATDGGVFSFGATC